MDALTGKRDPRDDAGVRWARAVKGAPEDGVGRRGYPVRRQRSILFNDPEWELVKDAARQHGKAPRVFLREIALGMLPAPKPGVVDAPWIRDLGRSATALTRLVAMAQASGALPLASTLEAALAEHMAIVRQVASDNRRVRRR